MVKLQISQTAPHWDAILQHVESGETVQLLRGDRVVAVVHAPEDLQGWAQASMQTLSKVLEPEDFSDWNPPHASR